MQLTAPRVEVLVQHRHQCEEVQDGLAGEVGPARHATISQNYTTSSLPASLLTTIPNTVEHKNYPVELSNYKSNFDFLLKETELK